MRRVVFVALVAAVGATGTGCPGKAGSSGGRASSSGEAASSPTNPADGPPRGGYHAKPVQDGHAIEVRVRFAGGGRPSGWTILPPMLRSQCGGAASAPNQALSVSGDGLDDAVVWLDDIHEGAPLEPAKAGAFEQDEKGCTFLPHVLAMPASGALTLKNSDPANHAVRFELKGESADESDDLTKTLPPGTSLGIDVKPDWAGRWARVTCPIHLWMSGYVHFFDHPYFAVTKAGVARLERVPAGRYHVRVWHEGIGATSSSSLKFPPPVGARAEVTVQDGDAKVAFTMGGDGKIAPAP
jgi:hypothetical protein